MLSITPYLLFIAGGIAVLVGSTFYFGEVKLLNIPWATNFWIIAAVFLSAGAITDTLNRLAWVLAGERERERRADVAANVLVGGIATLSVLVVAVFGLMIASVLWNDGTRMFPDEEREPEQSRHEAEDGFFQ